MAKHNLVKSVMMAVGLLVLPFGAWACEGAGPNTHIGTVTSVNAQDKTFTIRDAQTNQLITFLANNEIIDGLKDAKGSIMVNYEEGSDATKLKALGVTF